MIGYALIGAMGALAIYEYERPKGEVPKIQPTNPFSSWLNLGGQPLTSNGQNVNNAGAVKAVANLGSDIAKWWGTSTGRGDTAPVMVMDEMTIDGSSGSGFNDGNGD